MRNATPVLPFKTHRPTCRHYFLRINFRPFSFFTRTTRAKINPGYSIDDWLAGWMDFCLSSDLFQVATPPTVIVWFLRNLAHMIYVPVCKKTVEQIFKILILKFLPNFWNFQGDCLPGKPGNVKEFDCCQGNVRNFTKNQGNVGKKSCQGKVA